MTQMSGLPKNKPDVILRAVDTADQELILLRVWELTPGTWQVQAAVNKGAEIGTYARYVSHAGLSLLGVLKHAFNTISDDQLYMEGADSGSACSPNMARRQQGTLLEIQTGESELRNH